MKWMVIALAIAAPLANAGTPEDILRVRSEITLISENCMADRGIYDSLRREVVNLDRVYTTYSRVYMKKPESVFWKNMMRSYTSIRDKMRKFC